MLTPLDCEFHPRSDAVDEGLKILHEFRFRDVQGLKWHSFDNDSAIHRASVEDVLLAKSDPPPRPVGWCFAAGQELFLAARQELCGVGPAAPGGRIASPPQAVSPAT